jgi:thioredoxin-related protein
MTKIETLGNDIVILLAVVVGSVFLKDRFPAPVRHANEVKAGDRLTRLDSWDWAAQDRTLVLALRKGCHFCEDSAPFYQRLLSEHSRDGSTTAIVAAFPDTADAVKEVVQSEGLHVLALAGVPPEKLNVSGTPTLLLVDRSGTVLKAWIGMLSPREELEVMKALACKDESCG